MNLIKEKLLGMRQIKKLLLKFKERYLQMVAKTWSKEEISQKRRTMTVMGLETIMRKRNPILVGCTIILAK